MTTMIHTVLRRERSQRRLSALRRRAWELSKGFAWAVLFLIGFAGVCGFEQQLDRQAAVAMHPSHAITITER